jgi:hypothetical protein
MACYEDSFTFAFLLITCIDTGPKRVGVSPPFAPEEANSFSSSYVVFSSYLELWTMFKTHKHNDSEHVRSR